MRSGSAFESPQIWGLCNWKIIDFSKLLIWVNQSVSLCWVTTGDQPISEWPDVTHIPFQRLFKGLHRGSRNILHPETKTNVLYGSHVHKVILNFIVRIAINLVVCYWYKNHSLVFSEHLNALISYSELELAFIQEIFSILVHKFINLFSSTDFVNDEMLNFNEIDLLLNWCVSLIDCNRLHNTITEWMRLNCQKHYNWCVSLIDCNRLHNTITEWMRLNAKNTITDVSHL